MKQLNVVVTVNWEGRSLAGVEAIRQLRDHFPRIPVTHFVSAAYFARGGDYMRIVEEMMPAFAAHDEIALLLNSWESIHGCRAGAGERSHTVINGDDPALVIEYPGIEPQYDGGYTRALSGIPRSHIDALIRNSRLLLSPLLKQLVQRPGISVDALLRGARAGHSMAADAVLEALAAAGFDYDASAFDASWAWRRRDVDSDSPFGPWPGLLADLWGPEPHDERHLANSLCQAATAGTGVDWRSQPFLILADDRGELLEMPLNGGLVPPVSPAHLNKIANALAKLPSMAGIYLCFGFHQDTADTDLLRVIEESLAHMEQEFVVNWSTLAATADILLNRNGARSRMPLRPYPLRPPIRLHN